MNVSPSEFQMIVGKSPWRVWKGFGSFLLFEFGRRRRIGDGSQRGAYTLWISMANWRIRHLRRELAHSESSDARIQRAAETLTGKKLECIVLSSVVLRRKLRFGAMFHFAGGYTLRASMYDRVKDEEIFMIYSPKTWLAYSTKGTVISKPMARK